MIQLRDIRYAVRTDIGLKRKINEDQSLIVEGSPENPDTRDRGVMFAVADGMGGHRAGGLAGRMACNGLRDYYSDKICTTGLPFSKTVLLWHLEEIIHRINSHIRKRANTDKDCYDMGTTLSVLVLTKKDAIIAHVGDSRIYRIQQNGLEQLTVDHTFVQEMFAKGELSSEAASSHPLSHVLSQAVGTVESALDVFTRTLTIKPGEIFLLCSDGLHSMVPEGDILDIILSNPDPQQAVNRLVNLALANDGKDNITVILVHT